MDLLKLAALDQDDLDVLSAHVQDAVLTVGDLIFLKKEGRFLATLNRFAWENDGEKKERRRAAIHFDRVTRVRSHNIRQDAKDGVLSLLSVRFTANGVEDPSGIVELVFSGGGALRLEVECIEAQLTDLGASWVTDSMPSHDLSGTEDMARDRLDDASDDATGTTPEDATGKA